MLPEEVAVAAPAVTAPSVYRDPPTWAIAFVVFGAYTTISVSRLIQLNPTSWDLSIFTECVKQYAHFHEPIVDVMGAGTNMWGVHFSPALAAIAPFFRVFPSPATLLVVQALLAGASVFPVSAVAREKVGPGAARAIALSYGFSWGLQQMSNFDFHEIALAVPLLAFSLSALARGRIKATVLWAMPLVLVKEDQGFTVAALGMYLLFTGDRAADRARMRAGQFLTIWGLGWSLLAILVIIPHFNVGHVYSFWGNGGVLAPGGHASFLALVRQFCYAWPLKLQTVVLLLLPTAFIALRSPLVLIALPSIGLRFVSSDNAYWGTSWHYNAAVMPILFVAAVDALARMAAARQAAGTALDPGNPGPRGWWRAAQASAERHGAAMMVAIAAAMAFQFPLSSLWNGQTYEVGPHIAADNAAMAKVPDGATVLTTLNLLAPLAARTDTYWLANPGNPDTQYIVFDGQNTGTADVPATVNQSYPGHIYTQIFADDNVYVFRRNVP
jgi:uncharacterized membrane protein